MEKIPFCLFADDDSLFVRACVDEFTNFFHKEGIEFIVCPDLKNVEKSISGTNDKDLIIAILDLWFIDKDSNEANEEEGFEILKILRERWKNSYIIILSGHINGEVKRILKEFINIAIIEKPISPSKLLDFIEIKLKEIQK
jgi:DNA-binding response OmpR family regulator